MATLEIRTAHLAGLYHHDRLIVVLTAGHSRTKFDRFADGHIERTDRVAPFVGPQ